MVYLGPIEPRPVFVKAPKRPLATTPVAPYANENQLQQRSAGLAGIGFPGTIDRRKKDRRSKANEPLVETRAGRDRRKARKPSINISV